MNSMIERTSRRDFIKKSSIALAGLAVSEAGLATIAAPYIDSKRRIIGANDKIRVGFIGVGSRGTRLMQFFGEQNDCEVAALCDVYRPYITRDYSSVSPRYVNDLKRLIPKMGEVFSHDVKRYMDYRQLLENKDIDAVCIATPDHWHALQTVDAIQAGKDVYVEKPLSKTIAEGKRMVEVGRNSKQIVSVGLNRRSAPTFQNLAKEIPAGKIGKVTFASCCNVSNMFSNGIGKYPIEDPPEDFDWDMWLGPRAYRPYRYNIAPYRYRWWDDFGDQISNNGVHFLDLIRWILNEEAPMAVSAHGGIFAVDDDRTIPDTMQVTYEFKSGVLVTINLLEASSGSSIPYGLIELRGTKGTLHANENDYKITPTNAGRFQQWDKLMDEERFYLTKDIPLEKRQGYRNSTIAHIRNFLDCVKSRETPSATLEAGHRSTTMAHLGTIAMKVKQRIEWDAVNERVTNCELANDYLAYEYRKPWKL